MQQRVTEGEHHHCNTNVTTEFAILLVLKKMFYIITPVGRYMSLYMEILSGIYNLLEVKVDILIPAEQTFMCTSS